MMLKTTVRLKTKYFNYHGSTQKLKYSGIRFLHFHYFVISRERPLF